MTNKKLLQIVAIIAVAAALFTTIMAIGMHKIQKQRTEQTTEAPALSTTEPVTAAPTTQAPQVTIDGNRFGDDDTTQPTAAPTSETTEPTSASSGFVVPQSKDTVIKAYVDAVNKLKSTPDFTLEKTETLNVQIDEMNPSSMRSLANKIIAGNSKDSPTTYRFVNGSDSASGKSANFVIAPAGKTCALDPTLVTSATATPSANGGCMLKINLGSETQTVSEMPKKYSGCMDVLTVETMGLPSSARIDEMAVYYNYSSITAMLDSQGRLTEMEHRLVVTDATARGSYVMSVSSRMHGDASALYKITY